MSQYAVPTYDRLLRTTTGLVKTGSGVLYGWFVNVTTNAAVTLTDGAGATVLVIPTAAVVGTAVTGLGIGFATSLTATFAGTGSLTFIYR